MLSMTSPLQRALLDSAAALAARGFLKCELHPQVARLAALLPVGAGRGSRIGAQVAKARRAPPV